MSFDVFTLVIIFAVLQYDTIFVLSFSKYFWASQCYLLLIFHEQQYLALLI